VERTEGKRFRKYPSLHTTTQAGKVGGMNTVKAKIEDNTVQKVYNAKVYIAPKLKADKRIGEARLTLLHELRENLYFQNQGRMTKTLAHKKANAHMKQDWNYAKRGLVRT
jgi:hypothetical protein